MGAQANEIIDKLGGTASVARLFGIKQQSVSEWRTNGIPKPRLQTLKLLRPDLFGLPADTARNQIAINDIGEGGPCDDAA